MLPVSEPAPLRVCLRAGGAATDVALPADLSVAELIPAIIDLLGGNLGPATAAARYRLALPGCAALPPATTLAQHGVRDGAVLLLTEFAPPAPVRRQDDVAAGLADCLAGADPGDEPRTTRLAGALAAGALAVVGAVALIRNSLDSNASGNAAWIAAAAGLIALLCAAVAHRGSGDALAGLTLSLVATVFAAVAGLTAVPGRPGCPAVLLASMAAATMSALAARVAGCGAVPLTAVSGFAGVVAAAALTGELTGAPAHVLGSTAALVSLGLPGTAARAALARAGLSPWAEPDSPERLAAKAIRARNVLVSLAAAGAATAAVGAAVTAATARPSGFAFAAATGGLLLFRAHHDRRTRIVHLSAGIITVVTTFAMVASCGPRSGPWLATATAVLVAAACYLGFAAPALSVSAVARRAGALLECATLLAMAPLTAWICGVFGAVRGLDLS